MSIGSKLKMSALALAVQKGLDYLEKDPENNAIKVVDMIEKSVPEGWYTGQIKAIKGGIEEKGNWYQLVQRIYALDPGVRKTFFTNFIVNASLKGSVKQQENAEKYNCNVPWEIGRAHV